MKKIVTQTWSSSTIKHRKKSNQYKETKLKDHQTKKQQTDKTRKNPTYNQIKAEIINRNETRQYLNKITKTQIIKHKIKCEITRDLTEFHNFLFLKKRNNQSPSFCQRIYVRTRKFLRQKDEHAQTQRWLEREWELEIGGGAGNKERYTVKREKRKRKEKWIIAICGDLVSFSLPVL